MLTIPRFSPGIRAIKRMHASLTDDQRRAWGLRLQAIKGGRAVQRLYKLRGWHPLSKQARAERAAKAEEEKSKTRNKVIPFT